MSQIHIHQYTPEERKEFVSHMTGDMLGQADPYEIALYQQLVEEGCAQDDITCLRAKCYGCYGGNAAFPCDWDEARRCAERLLELTGEGSYANTLGYIYYYGRCSDGVPDYDAAFRYFSIGAFQGVIESLYKLSDMFIDGNGVPRNYRCAAGIILSLYHNCRDRFCSGEFDGKFADVVLRLGEIMEYGTGIDADTHFAYSCYLQASLAIRKRMETDPQYGDGSVSTQIRAHLDYLGGKLEEEGFFEDEMNTFGPVLMQQFLSSGYVLRTRAMPLPDGSYRIAFEKLVQDGLDAPYLELISIPEFRFCELLSGASFRIDEIDDIIFPQDSMDFLVDDIAYDEDEHRFYFLSEGNSVMEVMAGRFYVLRRDLVK